MLHASEVVVLLTDTDLESVLREFSAGQVDDLKVTTQAGSLLLRVEVSGKPLPMAMTVELLFTVLDVAQTRVRLGVAWPNLRLLPGTVKELVLQRTFSALPGDYQDGIYTVDIDTVLDHLPLSFTVAGLEIAPGGVRVRLVDLVLYPLQVGELAGVEVQPGAIVPVLSAEESTLPEHQSYYQKLRTRMQTYAVQKAPTWVQPLVPWVLAAPDFFVLLVRLARDPRVSPAAKVMAGVAVAYFISPVDLIPDLLPILGHVDDLGVALLAVEQIASRVPPEVVAELWPGDGAPMELVKTGVELFSRALPARMLVVLRQLIRRGGGKGPQP